MFLRAIPDSATGRELFYLPYQPVVIKSISITTKIKSCFRWLVKINHRNILESKIKWAESAAELVEYHHPFQSTSICDDGRHPNDSTISSGKSGCQQRIEIFNGSFERNDSTKALRTYTLKTVTYDTTCASYLAMRCLQHLTMQSEAVTRQATVQALLYDFYMNDVLTGSHTVKQAVKLRRELSELLQAAEFLLRK